jgi:hypothetical protein
VSFVAARCAATQCDPEADAPLGIPEFTRGLRIQSHGPRSARPPKSLRAVHFELICCNNPTQSTPDNLGIQVEYHLKERMLLRCIQVVMKEQ